MAGDEFLSQFGSATVRNNTFETYQKGGLLFGNANARPSIATNNTFDGGGPSAIIARNGIQISDGVVATVSNNTVRNHIYTTDSTSATGIIVVLAGAGTQISQNVVRRNDDNIALYQTSGVTVFRNTASASTKYDGLYADSGSAGNTFRLNLARNNVLFDCEDDSTGAGTGGTANSWQSNDGITADPPPICTRGAGDNAGAGGEGGNGGGNGRDPAQTGDRDNNPPETGCSRERPNCTPATTTSAAGVTTSSTPARRPSARGQ